MTIKCPKCGSEIQTHPRLPIATCPNCGHVTTKKADPRRQRPTPNEEQKPL